MPNIPTSSKPRVKVPSELLRSIRPRRIRVVLVSRSGSRMPWCLAADTIVSFICSAEKLPFIFRLGDIDRSQTQYDYRAMSTEFLTVDDLPLEYVFYSHSELQDVSYTQTYLARI